METSIRLKLDMGNRADLFCKAHPDPDPVNMQVATRLTEHAGRANDLMLLYRTSEITAAAAVDQKAALRSSIELGLSALFGIGRAASATHHELTIHRRTPGRHASEVTLLTTTRVAVTQATASKDLLVPFGLTQDLLDGLTRDADAFEAEGTRQANAEAAKVGARAELKAVVAELMACVKNLDHIFKHRFKNDRELLAAWKSARNVAWPLSPPAPTDPTAPKSPNKAA